MAPKKKTAVNPAEVEQAFPYQATERTTGNIIAFKTEEDLQAYVIEEKKNTLFHFKARLSAMQAFSRSTSDEKKTRERARRLYKDIWEAYSDRVDRDAARVTRLRATLESWNAAPLHELFRYIRELLEYVETATRVKPGEKKTPREKLDYNESVIRDDLRKMKAAGRISFTSIEALQKGEMMDFKDKKLAVALFTRWMGETYICDDSRKNRIIEDNVTINGKPFIGAHNVRAKLKDERISAKYEEILEKILNPTKKNI